MLNPVSGNQGFTKVDNTALSAQSLQAALSGGNVQPLLVAKGYAVLTTSTGNFAVQNNGVTLSLPQNALVLRVSLVGDGTLETAGTSTLEVGTAATDGGVVADGFHAPVTPGAVVVGALSPVVNQSAGSLNNFVSVTVGTAGAAVGGSLAVSVLYYVV